MSRPGFVFDLSAPDAVDAIVCTCRGCGVTVGGARSSAELDARVKIHVRERHALANADAWTITHHDRAGREVAVCLWSPEAV